MASGRRRGVKLALKLALLALRRTIYIPLKHKQLRSQQHIPKTQTFNGVKRTSNLTAKLSVLTITSILFILPRQK